MLKIIFVFILFFSLFIFLAGFSFVRFLARIFGLTPPPPSKQKKTSTRKNHATFTESRTSSRKKIFDKDQGEYTDYEEIK